MSISGGQSSTLTWARPLLDGNCSPGLSQKAGQAYIALGIPQRISMKLPGRIGSANRRMPLSMLPSPQSERFGVSRPQCAFSTRPSAVKACSERASPSG